MGHHPQSYYGPLDLKWGWVTLIANFRGNGASPPTTVGVRKVKSLGYHVALFAWFYV